MSFNSERIRYNKNKNFLNFFEKLTDLMNEYDAEFLIEYDMDKPSEVEGVTIVAGESDLYIHGEKFGLDSTDFIEILDVIKRKHE